VKMLNQLVRATDPLAETASTNIPLEFK
jgi:hypothetical protein